MAFAEQLRALMDRKDMKAVDLARATGLSEAAISDYLKGKKEPRGKQSVALAKALGVSLDVLWETGFGLRDNTISGAQKSGLIEEKPTVHNNSDDELVASILRDRRKGHLVKWLASLDEQELDRFEKLLDIVDFGSKK